MTLRSVFYISVVAFGLALAVAGLGDAAAPIRTNSVSFSGHLGAEVATSTVTVTAAGAGIRNCLTHLTTISSLAYTLTVFDGSNAIWRLSLPANTGYTDDWPLGQALCGSPNTQMQIGISTGTYQINYQGYTY